MAHTLQTTLLQCLSKQHFRRNKSAPIITNAESTSLQAKASKFLNFAVLSSIVFVFQNTMDARQALQALLTHCKCSTQAQLLYAREVITELLKRHDKQTVSEIAQLSELHSTHTQLLGYARQGCCFINTHAETKADTEEVQRCVRRFHPKRVQMYKGNDIDGKESEVANWPTITL